jgi:hypothetical protein
MSRPKRHTALERFYFSGIPLPETNTELCTADTMPVPGRIASDPMKKELWDFIVADMQNRRCLSTTYLLLITELVEVLSMMHECREKISENGMVTTLFDDEGSFKGEMESPYVKILARQQPILIKILEKLGMNPRDISYLINTEASAIQPIEAQVADFKAVTYFRS